VVSFEQEGSVVSEWLQQVGLDRFLTPERMIELAQAFVTVVVGLIVARVAASAAGRTFARRIGDAEGLLARRFTFYLLAALALVSALHQVGFKLGVLLGAAGILTVAIGFAAQTSASNLISGLFLIAERPFKVGDVIRVEDVTGQILSVDLLSVKLRTFDNLFVRMPNESLIKSRVTNLTRFPIRRVDLALSVAYKEDLARVEELLVAVADRNPASLEEPGPEFFVRGFGESGIDLQFSVWTVKENYVILKNSLLSEIQTAFREKGIEIPYPHRIVVTQPVADAGQDG
jgi:small-conductance mechanosensitive channel